MKPPRFAYAAPTTVDEVLDALRLEPDDTTVLAGGQSLMPMLNMRMAAPRVVVDLNGVGELAGIDADGECALGCVVGTHPGKELPFHLEAGLPVRRRLLGAGKCSGYLTHGVPVGHGLKIVSAGR